MGIRKYKLVTKGLNGRFSTGVPYSCLFVKTYSHGGSDFVSGLFIILQALTIMVQGDRTGENVNILNLEVIFGSLYCLLAVNS